jgi:hypothetical protein
MSTIIPQAQRVPMVKTRVGSVEYPGYIERAWYDFLVTQAAAAVNETSVDLTAINAELLDLQTQIDALGAPDLTAIEARLDALEADMGAAQADIVALEAAVAAIVAPEVVSVTLDFGASFTDKAQTVVTGQTWVSLSSVITPTVMCPLGIDTDEIRLLDMRPVISDLVAGVGFTVTLYSEPEARGTYTVSCVGV